MTTASLRTDRHPSVNATPNCRFVESDEFCRLLVGNGRMVRADEAGQKLRGLLDLETGVRYLIEQRKLATSVF